MADAGADLIELGIPFSDPTAEGPVIQEANVRALSAGTTTDKIFDMVRRIRQKTDIPMVFMTYANVVYSFGSERFISTAAETGMARSYPAGCTVRRKGRVRSALPSVRSGSRVAHRADLA